MAKLVRQADGTFKAEEPKVKVKADGTASKKAPNENTVIWIYKADIMNVYAGLVKAKIAPADGVTDAQKRTVVNQYITMDVIVPAIKKLTGKYLGEPKAETAPTK